MSLTNSFSRYGSVAKSFHWATVLLIFTAFPVGYFANELAHQINAADFDGDAGIISRATFLFSLHKTLGVTAFFTALLRILWAITQEKPGLLHPDNRGEALVAEAVHWLLCLDVAGAFVRLDYARLRSGICADLVAFWSGSSLCAPVPYAG